METTIELTLPARIDFFYLVRLHVAAVASRIDMTLEDVEDLHLAAEELCMSVLSQCRGVPDRLAVEIAWDDAVIGITCRLVGEEDHETPSGPWTNEGYPALLSNRILDALVDEHGVAADSEQPCAWLRKRREPSLPGS
jgi:hypothetical protein